MMNANQWAGERVFVYYDLHRECWFLKSLKTGRVLNYRDLPGGGREKILVREVGILGAEFKVSEAGRQRVIQEQSKNIHAGVVGLVLPVTDAMRAGAKRGVKYNPYKYSTFVDALTLEPVHSAQYAVLVRDGDKASVTVPKF